MYGSLTDCPQGLNNPTHVCSKDCQKERSSSKHSSSLKLNISKTDTRSPIRSRSPSSSLSPTEGVETPLLPLSSIQSNLKGSMAYEDELSGRSWSTSSRTSSSSYLPPGDVNSEYHGFVGDDDPTFSIVSRVSRVLVCVVCEGWSLFHTCSSLLC